METRKHEEPFFSQTKRIQTILKCHTKRNFEEVLEDIRVKFMLTNVRNVVEGGKFIKTPIT